MSLNIIGFLSIHGITNGAIYALIGLLLAFTYNVTRVINVAQGEFLMLGALTAVGLTTGGSAGGLYLAIIAGAVWAILSACKRGRWWLAPGAIAVCVALLWGLAKLQPFSLPPLAAAVVAIAAVAFLGAATYRITIQPAGEASDLTFIIITTGMYLVFQGLGLIFWGSGSFGFPSIYNGMVTVGITHVSYQSILILLSTITIMIFGWFLAEHTQFGNALRACAMNSFGARLTGISPTRAGLFTFAASAGLSAFAGVLIMPVTYATYNMGLFLALKGLIAAIIGGFSRYGSVAVGGLLLGVIESFTSYFTSTYNTAIVFGLIIVILLVRTLVPSRGRVV